MADAASNDRKNLVTTAVIILLLTLMGAGVGFTVGVFLKPVEPPADSIAVSDAKKDEAPSGDQSGEKSAHSAEAASVDKEGDPAPPPEPLAGDEEPLSADLAVVPFPPVVTALANPRGKWIRLEGAVLVRSESKTPPEQIGQRAAEQMLTYLKTVNLSDIEGPSGFLALRHDLNDTVRALSDGSVRGVLIHGLIVE